jgi:hypothetical protein
MNNETDVRQVMERTTTEDSAKIQEPERATGDGDAIDAEVLSLRSQLTTLTQERDALRKAAKEATNGWACYARTNREHDEIARLHGVIDALVDQGASK